MKKGEKSKRVSFRYFKEHRKIAFCLILGVGFAFALLAINYGRYVKDIFQMYYLRSQNFYFSSDRLTIHGKEYEIEPWNMEDDYTINLNLNSKLNNLEVTTEDIVFDITCETIGENASKIDCSFSETSIKRALLNQKIQVINDNTTTLNLYVSKLQDASDGDKLSVKVTATSKSPYAETLSATFTLIKGDYEVSYEIEDSPGDVYFKTIVTNASDNVSDITLTIPNAYLGDHVVLDMTNPILTSTDYDVETQTNSNGYIQVVKFTMQPKTSMMLRYYKLDKTKNFSYVKGGLIIGNGISTTEPAVLFEYE